MVVHTSNLWTDQNAAALHLSSEYRHLHSTDVRTCSSTHLCSPSPQEGRAGLLVTGTLLPVCLASLQSLLQVTLDSNLPCS